MGIRICITDSDAQKELKYFNVFIEKQCDGILFIGKSLKDELIEQIAISKIPVVFGALTDSQDRIPSVSIDNEQASYDLTMHLIENGHKKVAFFDDEDQTSFVGIERKKG